MSTQSAPPLRSVAAVWEATLPRRGVDAAPARFALEVDEFSVESGHDLRARIVAGLPAQFAPDIAPLSVRETGILVLDLLDRTFEGVARAAVFAAAYALALDFGLASAEPDLAGDYFPLQPEPAADPSLVEEGVSAPIPGCWTPRDPELDADPLWALDRIRAAQAWAWSEREGRPSRGGGVTVAQPDTGVTAHAAMAGVVSAPGRDVLDDDPDPTDPMLRGAVGHGTATASVLVATGAGRTLPVVQGVAPLARHMPLRAIESVVAIRQVAVARSIEWAVEQGAHVLTMSLGGLPSTAVHRAIRRAVAADVIVLAAAGNCVRYVVYPARYDECIAVAGVDSRDIRWQGSCRGAAVDISAPAENVFRAVARPGALTGVDQGQGTSFAVAVTAGVAALWLAHHGRATLVGAARARGETLQEMFRRLLQATARRPPDWEGREMGAGVVDAQSLLACDLDRTREWETVDRLPGAPERAADSVKSLVAEAAGSAAVDDALDWRRFGPEIVATLLGHSVPGLHEETPVEAGVTPDLDAAVHHPRLREQLGLPAAAPAPGSTADSVFGHGREE